MNLWNNYPESKICYILHKYSVLRANIVPQYYFLKITKNM